MIKFGSPEIGEEALVAIQDVLKSGWIRSGPKTKELEQSFSNITGSLYAIATSNCTAALHLALLALDVRGGEVIVPSLTFAATANTVVHAGAIPIFAEIDPVTWTLDLNDVEKKISKLTRAVIPVHLFGLPCDLQPLMEMAEQHKFQVVEDCAYGLGAKYHNKSVGTLGVAGCFSFGVLKNITTGEGGIVITDNSEMADAMRTLRNNGMNSSRQHTLIGLNYNLTDIQAVMGNLQLPRLTSILERRRLLAQHYSTILSKNSRIQLPWESSHRLHNYTFYSVRIEGINAQKLTTLMSQRGIEIKHHMPVHLEPVYIDRFGTYRGQLPETERVASELVSLPMYTKLSKDDLTYIANSLLTALDE